MRITSLLATPTLALLLLASSPMAQADQRADTGFYLGGSIGGVTLSDSPFDPQNVALAGFAGWQIVPMFGIEASYLEMGRVENDDFKLKVDGYTLAGTVRFPLTRGLAIYGKGGVIRLNNDMSGVIVSGRESRNDTDQYYAAGIDLELSNRLEVRLSYEVFDFDFGRDIQIGPFFRDLNSDVEIVSIGLLFEF